MVRYEQKHIHIDWHEDPVSGLKVCAILDDSTRMIMSIDEFATINTENSIAIIERAIQGYGSIYPLREIDYGYPEIQNFISTSCR